MKTYEIHISGRVQGVGFRPFVYNLAHEYGIQGFVSNDESGVIIMAQGDDIADFYQAVLGRKPGSAEIVSSSICETIENDRYGEFVIRPTAENIVVDIPLTPDFAICANCTEEMLDPENRRYFYPFTTCTQCGPRYSVTRKFPFERENTAIKVFEMCPACRKEYTDHKDVRFHSQTNTCPKCGIAIRLKDNNHHFLEASNPELFEKMAEVLAEGKIIACKNTAGYLLLCDATSYDAVARLRQRKNRPTKPFAVLFRNLEQMRTYIEVSGVQEEKFLSAESPVIVSKVQNKGDLALEQISPGMNTVGAMYPYSGTLKLIAETFRKPMIATSGNLHGAPVCASTEDSEYALAEVADFFLHNTLSVEHAQDDSVVKYSPQYSQKVIFRRARGLAPNYLFSDELRNRNPEGEKILCLGGDLKNTFAIVPNNHVYISEYIGDLANFDTYRRFEKTIHSYQEIFSFVPEIVIKDLHPKYYNQEVVQEFPETKVFGVQHHIAHFSAILGEKKLWNRHKVLGIVWDGVGYGAENEIWGGEIFGYRNGNIRRMAHLEEFSWILGDKMSVSPKISALCVSGADTGLREFFDDNEWKIATSQILRTDLKTTSMGRLFDAVAFVLGFRREMSFEGEASMWLEKTAQEAMDNGSVKRDYLQDVGFINLPVRHLFRKIMDESETGVPPGVIALNFHYTLITSIRKMAGEFFEKDDEKHLAFSGGVWQNTLLMDLAIEILGREFILNFHEELSPNDENISFGQLNYYLNILKH
ncbi:carbamoyltransferase HypF [Weeksellaceae bacterium A-14]